MKVRIKKLDPNAVMPTYAHATDAGMDLTAVSKSYDEYGNTVYDTGLAFEIPEGYVGLLFPRSSNHKKDLDLTNCVGVLDAGYRGSVSFKYRTRLIRIPFITWVCSLLGWHVGKMGILHGKEYKVGDHVGQMIILPYPKIELEWADELGFGERGVHGYGSTGD